ncbi:MAG: hypothetical protein RMX65_028145 [Nostoc sp. DedQUE01]|nr:hypothetical protein [Nostoc sp. DedQUE01]MDZ8080613.1 hypothetical protein [Nostoc sp. DcaGUA01]
MQKFQLKAAHSLVAIGKRDGDRNQGRCEFLIIFRTYPRFTRRFALAKVSRREGVLAVAYGKPQSVYDKLSFLAIFA